MPARLGSKSKHVLKTGSNDWRADTLDRMRTLIREAAPGVVEEQKWRKPSNPDGVTLFSREGMICTCEKYKDKVKLTFAYGAALPDPGGLFNAPGTGGTRRAIDIREGETVNATKFKTLVKAAVALNSAKAKPANKASSPKAAPVKLLSGGNPQIAKGDGDAPVQAYIAAMPEWKRGVGEWLDATISRAVPKVKKAVKWNSPFYGTVKNDWFLSLHVFTKFVRVTWFNGTRLRPMPAGTSKVKDVRYTDIRQGDNLDTELLSSLVKQAAAMPGWNGH